MSRFYGTIDGSGKTQATRRGFTSLTTHAAGWKGAIRVEIGDCNGTDTFNVSLVPWKNSGGQSRELASGVLDSNAPDGNDYKAYQRELCRMIVARLAAQNITGKAKTARAAIDILCGAAAALHLANSPYYNGVAILATLVSARGFEVVANVSEDKPL